MTVWIRQHSVVIVHSSVFVVTDRILCARVASCSPIDGWTPVVFSNHQLQTTSIGLVCSKSGPSSKKNTKSGKSWSCLGCHYQPFANHLPNMFQKFSIAGWLRLSMVPRVHPSSPGPFCPHTTSPGQTNTFDWMNHTHWYNIYIYYTYNISNIWVIYI